MADQKLSENLTHGTTKKRLIVIIVGTVLLVCLGSLFIVQPSLFLPDKSFELAEKLRGKTPENEIKKFFNTAKSGTQTDLEKYWITNPAIKSDEGKNEGYTVYKGLLMREFIDAKYTSYEIKDIEWWQRGCCEAPVQKLDSVKKADFARVRVVMKKDNNSKEYKFDLYNTTDGWYDELDVGQEKLRTWEIYEVYSSDDQPFYDFIPQKEPVSPVDENG